MLGLFLERNILWQGVAEPQQSSDRLAFSLVPAKGTASLTLLLCAA